MNKKIIVGLGGFLLVVSGIWYMATPHTYEDCILKNVKSGMSEVAVGNVKAACLVKFASSYGLGSESCKKRSLTSEEISKIKGEGWLTNYGYFEASIYNGNSDFVVKNVIVSIEDKKSSIQQEYQTFGDSVQPLSAGKISAKLAPVPEKLGGWKVVSAETCK